jgi:hypothetical protein
VLERRASRVRERGNPAGKPRKFRHMVWITRR